MSGPPGIVYQTWRSISSLHRRQFIFFNSRIISLSYTSHDPRNKIFLTSKSWFKFLDVTESKNKCLKNTILLVLSASVRFLPANFRFTDSLFGAASRPTWSEPPSSFVRSCRIIRHGRKFTRLNVRRMSHSPGIVYQTPRSFHTLIPFFF